MIWIQFAVMFVFGLISGIILTKHFIRKGIREADIASDDKRMIQDTLGIRP